MSLVGNRLVRFVGAMRFPRLVAVTAALFVVNVVVPEALPVVDEILLGLVTVMLARIKHRDVPVSGAPRTPAG